MTVHIRHEGQTNVFFLPCFLWFNVEAWFLRFLIKVSAPFQTFPHWATVSSIGMQVSGAWNMKSTEARFEIDWQDKSQLSHAQRLHNGVILRHLRVSRRAGETPLHVLFPWQLSRETQIKSSSRIKRYISHWLNCRLYRVKWNNRELEWEAICQKLNTTSSLNFELLLECGFLSRFASAACEIPGEASP